MQGEIDTLLAFARDLEADELDHVVWCGMGGSSLFPELLAATVAAGQGAAPTGPVVHGARQQPPGRGRAHRGDRFRSIARSSASRRSRAARSRPSATSTTSARGSRARTSSSPSPTPAPRSTTRRASEGFRAVFNANPDIGGRYSALSHFGMLPAALLGIDIAAILRGAVQMVEQCGSAADSPGAALAAALGAGVRTGRDKLTIDVVGAVRRLGRAARRGVDRQARHRDPARGPRAARGARPLRRATASSSPTARRRARRARRRGPTGRRPRHASRSTAAARRSAPRSCAGRSRSRSPARSWASTRSTNPTSRPRRRRRAPCSTRASPTSRSPRVADALATVKPGDYVAIQAFVDPASPYLERFQTARVAVRDRFKVATTLAVGPRYLHSTGQFHKGGPPSGVFLQVLDVERRADVDDPGPRVHVRRSRQRRGRGRLPRAAGTRPPRVPRPRRRSRGSA